MTTQIFTTYVITAAGPIQEIRILFGQAICVVHHLYQGVRDATAFSTNPDLTQHSAQIVE